MQLIYIIAILFVVPDFLYSLFSENRLERN